MFGSLVIVFPTPHEGGALHLRHRGQEWIFDSFQVLAAKDKPSIGYAAFFSDIEHEVALVTSGHRVTLTYNLYFDDDGPISANDDIYRRPAPPLVNEGPFREAFTALLENPEFLAEGGMLAFGLRHVYPIRDSDDLRHVYNVLKGSDAVVYQGVRTIGFEPVLYMYYKFDGRRHGDGVLVGRVVNFTGFWETDDRAVIDFLHEEGGVIATRDRERLHGVYGETLSATAEVVEWVTPMTTINQKEGAYVAYYGNEPSLDFVYGEVCLVVRIGKAGDRLAYPAFAELERRRSYYTF